MRGGASGETSCLLPPEGVMSGSQTGDGCSSHGRSRPRDLHSDGQLGHEHPHLGVAGPRGADGVVGAQRLPLRPGRQAQRFGPGRGVGATGPEQVVRDLSGDRRTASSGADVGWDMGVSAAFTRVGTLDHRCGGRQRDPHALRPARARRGPRPGPRGPGLQPPAAVVAVPGRAVGELPVPGRSGHRVRQLAHRRRRSVAGRRAADARRPGPGSGRAGPGAGAARRPGARRVPVPAAGGLLAGGP